MNLVIAFLLVSALGGDLQQFPVDLNQDGFRGPGEALWH
jgi:hypothetical protein